MTEQITQILQDYGDDPDELSRRLIPVVYESLRHMAREQMARERRQMTLQPTALVHEAYFRLMGHATSWQNRRHFFGAAAEAMRRVLIDQARRRRRIRHGGGMLRTTVDLEQLHNPLASPDALELDDVLDKLESAAPRKGLVVKLRYFLGLSIDETADVLNVSRATVKLDWSYAKAWLHRELTARHADHPRAS